MSTNRNVRTEEIVPIALDTQDSFLQAAILAAFLGFSPKRFGPAFQDAFAANIAASSLVVGSSFFIKEIKLLRINLHKNANSLRQPLSLLEGYVEFAAPHLTVLPKDFGISQVREQLSAKNMEGVVSTMKIVNKNIETNIDALTTIEDMPLSMQTDFVTITQNIETDGLDRKTKIKTKEEAVQANAQVFDELWEQVLLILKTGKRLFKYTDREKTREFTLEVIKSRVRRVVHKSISGDMGGGAQSGEYSPKIPGGAIIKADFIVKPTDNILCSVTGNTSLWAFFSKLPNVTTLPTEKTLMEPGDEEVLTPSYHPDPETIYLYIANVDPHNEGEVTIDLVD